MSNGSPSSDHAPAGPGGLGLDRLLNRGAAAAVLRDTTGLLLIAQATTAVVALLANILSARSLMADGRGELALLLQLAYLGTLGVSLGTDRSVVTVYGGAPVDEAVRAQVRLLVRPALVAVCVGLASDLALPLVGLGRWRAAGLVVSGFVISNAFVRASRAVAIAGNRQHDYLLATIAEQFLLIAALGALALADVTSVVAWVAAYALTCIGPVIFYLVRWSRTGPRPGTDDAERRRAARREGLQLVPSTLANTGMLRIDRLLLPAMASTAALGHYASVSTFTELLTWPLLAFADNRTGVWRGRHDDGRLSVRPILLAAAGFVIVGALATAALTWFMVPLLGPGFDTVRALIPPLVAAAGVLGLSQIVMALLIARRRNTWASVSDSGGFVVSLLAYVTLIPLHGAAGAAWGSLIGYGAALALGVTALLVPDRAADRRSKTTWRGAASTPRVGPLPPVFSGPDRPGRGALAGSTLMLVVFAGRYTLDRAGVTSLAWVDLRVVGLVVACGLVAVELRTCGGLKGHQSAGWVVATLLFFGYQLLSIGWSPPGAELAAGAVDLVCLAALFLAVYLHARTWPETAGWRMLWVFWVIAVVFALGAFLVTGAGEQGRYAAFGGGPNVFVRIEALGLIAVVVLIAHGASRHLLWSVPLLLAGIVASGSRGGLLALGVVGGAAVLAGRKKARRVAGLAVVATALALTAVYRLGLPGAELIRSRFVEQTLQEGYASDRPGLYLSAMQLGWEHPFIGVGIDGWRVLVGDQLGIVYPHNYLLSVTAEGGAIGLILLGVGVVLWLRTVRALRPWAPLTTGMVASAAFIALASMTSGDYYDSRLAWCCAAVAVATAAKDPERRAESGPGAPALASSIHRV